MTHDSFISTPCLHLQKPLQEYIIRLESLRPRLVGLFTAVMEHDVVYDDPYHCARGHDNVTSIFKHRDALHDKLSYRVHDVVFGREKNTVYIYWSCIFQTKGGVFKRCHDSQEFQAMSRVLFSENGLIASVQEYWSAHHRFNAKSYARLDLR